MLSKFALVVLGYHTKIDFLPQKLELLTAGKIKQILRYWDGSEDK